MTGGRLARGPRAGALPPTEPCERCGAQSWRTERPGLWSGTLSWLGSGGHWRPERAVCESCGLQAGSGGWAMMLVGGAPRRWTLPLRLVRTLLRTVSQERRAEPVPWLYLASAAVGGVVGAVAAVSHVGDRHLTHTDRRVAARTAPRGRRRMPGGDHGRRPGPAGLAGAVGAAAGMLVCWSVFASTALRRPTTWLKLQQAALEQVSPARARERRERQHDRLVRSAPFPVYGLEEWSGPRRVAGCSSEGSRPVLTSVTLEHRDRAEESDVWVRVESAAGHGPVDDGIEDVLAADLWHATWEPPPGTGDVAADHLALVGARTRARARARARADQGGAPWGEGSLVVEGRSVPARWLADGEHWVAHATVDRVRVALQARAVPLHEIRLEVADLDSYTPFD